MSGSQTSRSSNLDLPTLLVTAVASATAAYVTSKLWTPGTLAAAAFTPVLIALIKEALYKPAEVVTRAVPVRGVVRSTSSAGQPERPAEAMEVIEERVPQLGEARGHSPPRRRRRWKVAIATGLLGFALATVIITVPELLSDGSVAGGGRETTLFGGGSDTSSDLEDTTTTSPEDRETEVRPPADAVTVPPPAGAITVPPPAPVPVPEEQTPPPPPQEEPVPPASPPAPPG